MKTKYEIIEVNRVDLTVDVSLLSKTEEMFFNATQMAKPFGKRPIDWLRLPDTKAYIDAILEVRKSHFENSLITLSAGNYEDLVKTKKGGKYQGTWLHTDLSIAFARWLSPIFSVRLDMWTKARINQAHDWEQKRLAAKTGYLPLTLAIQNDHDPAMFYHYSNEANMLNKIVTGMSAKKFKKVHGVESVRDAMDASQLKQMDKLQKINSSLIELGVDYEERKEQLSCLNSKQLEN